MKKGRLGEKGSKHLPLAHSSYDAELSILSHWWKSPASLNTHTHTHIKRPHGSKQMGYGILSPGTEGQL